MLLRCVRVLNYLAKHWWEEGFANSLVISII
jgi:hypothetical protein